jgi:acyl-CoA thioester hydrolase
VLFTESRLSLAVRPNDFDSLGHVNNAVAAEYLEAGRWDWLARQGLAGGRQVIAVVSRCEIDYLSEISSPSVEVHTVLDSPTESEFDEDALTYRARFRQRIHVPDRPSPAVDALITVGFLNAEQRSLVSLQDYLAAAVPR